MSEVEGGAGSAADSPAVMGEREAPVLAVSQSSPRPAVQGDGGGGVRLFVCVWVGFVGGTRSILSYLTRVELPKVKE